MDLMQFIIFLIYLSAAFLSMEVYSLELKRDLMMFQQNSYRYGRYRRWLTQSADSTSGMRLCGYALFLLSLTRFSLLKEWPVMLLFVVFGIVYTAKARKAVYKKPLVWTRRATRIYAVGTVIPLLVALAVLLFMPAGFFWMAVSYMGFYIGSHLMIMVSNWLLTPVEKHITGKYYRDARKRLEQMPGLKIIGITGSYGKTSTKHYLERIVAEKYQVTMTPGSFNTTLGVVRTVRENLKPYDEVFIVEMGAKNRGDIKEICDLVHPHIGIITAVGEQHLESFKTIENVQATKFELADALPAGGLAILNDDFPYVANRPVENCRAVRYAVDNTDDTAAGYVARDIECTRKGTRFTVCGPDGYRLALETRLLGSCNISNLLAAVIAAREIGVEDRQIARAVAAIEPVEHRLSRRTTAGGITIIDDAFNSNPAGSSMALDVLSMMTPGKRIVITPGMIELGEREYELNRAFGEKIAASADVAIVVGRYNRDAIVEGIRSAGRMNEGDIHAVDTFAQAQQVLQGICAPGDTVLYENDLPDTFK